MLVLLARAIAGSICRHEVASRVAVQGAWITSFGDAQSGAIAVNGTANLPVSAASLASSMDQLITGCSGEPSSVTCTFADNDGSGDSQW